MKIHYNDDSRVIIDVTKAPYFCDPTGKQDCTAALRRALDDILLPNVVKLEELKQKLLTAPDSSCRIGFENRKEDGKLYLIFPEHLEPTRILYFPRGEYLVSDTVTYTLENLGNSLVGERYAELNRQIYIKGECRDGVVIRLKDHAPGFGFGSHRPVVSFMRWEKSNVAMANCFENITIDVGNGNPGAVGLVFYANNTGTVRNVSIRSADPDLRGYTGLEISHELISGCLVNHVQIEGFDFGIRATPLKNHMVFEDVELRSQRICGFFVGNSVISARNIRMNGVPKGMDIYGNLAHVAMTDSVITGGHPSQSAVQCAIGSSCFLRNVRTSGFPHAVTYAKEVAVESDDITEYVSDEVITLFPTEKLSQPLPVLDTPRLPWPERWTTVDQFGAVGDGVADDTQAIRDAMASGAAHILFLPGKYRLSGSVEIPESVEHVNFGYCDFVAEESLIQEKERGAFIVTGDEGTLILEDVFAWEGFYGYVRFLEHAGRRTLVMSDLHVQTAAMYFNSVEGGKVFIEDCGCTTGGFPYRNVTGFSFAGQQVWARHINPERSMCEILNDHSKVWILGFKTESFGTVFKTVGGGHTEVLGGTISLGRNQELPAVFTENSTCSIVATSNGYSPKDIFPLAIREVRNGEIRELPGKKLPERYGNFFKIPLYVTR